MPQVDVFFHRIRSQFESKTPPPLTDASSQTAAKVIARNNDCFVSEMPAKTFVDFERRAGHRLTGFDALAHLPYRAFAGLKHTDPHSLIEDELGLSVHRNHNKQNSSESSGEWLCSKASSCGNQQTIRVVRDSSGKKSKTFSKTAGLSAIHLHLASSERALRDVAAGAAYKDTIPREEERRDFLLKMRAPKVAQKGRSTDDSCSLHNPSIYLPPLVHTASSRVCLTLQRPHPHSTHRACNKRQHVTTILFKSCDAKDKEGMVDDEINADQYQSRVGANLYVAFAAAHFKMHFGQSGRKKEISPAKKFQRRQCLAKLKAVYSILCCLYNMKMKELKNKRPISMTGIQQMSAKPLAIKEGAAHHHALRFGMHAHTYHTHTISSIQPQRAPGHSVETWEDLMLATKSHTHTGNTDPSSLAAPSTTMEPQQKLARVLPPWQRQVVIVDNSSNSTSDAAAVMAECINGFQSAKDQISEQTKLLLRRRQQGSSHQMALKDSKLRLGANTESCLQEMREKVYQINRVERAQEENRPAWYGQLEKEVWSSFEPRASSSHADYTTGRGTVRELLEKMKYFLYTDIEAVPRVTEKLCLLVMSVPSNQLCLQPVIAAVQFVLEEILEVPGRLCLQWLEMRGISSVGVALPSQPVIVFGQTV